MSTSEPRANKESLFDWLENIDPQERKQLRLNTVTRHYKAGELVYNWGDKGGDFYHITAGEIKLSSLSWQGKELIYTHFHCGESFGELSMLDQLPRAHYATATCTTVLQCLTREQLNRLRSHYPQVNDSLLNILCQRLRTMFDLFDDINLMSLPERIANRLCHLAGVEHTHQLPATASLQVTQEQLGNMLGVSRQMVSKVLKTWEAQKLISIHYGQISILALDKLMALAGMKQTIPFR